MYRPPTTHHENRTAEISASAVAMNNVVTSVAIPDAVFSAVRFCNYTVRRTQYDRPSWRQNRFLLLFRLAVIYTVQNGMLMIM